MSTSELGELEAVVERVLADPSGYLETLMRELMERLGTPAETGPSAVITGYDALLHEELVDRNLILAAALGACDCWGTVPDCRVCSGAGGSGWADPEPALFAEYVAPALARAAEQHLGEQHLDGETLGDHDDPDSEGDTT